MRGLQKTLRTKRWCWLFRHLLCLALASSLVLSAACGKKAPPLPPTGIEPPVVENLEARVDEGKITLLWKPPKTAEGGGRVIGFYVYRSKDRLSEDFCEGCPVRFTRVADLPFDMITARFRSHESYAEFLEKGFRYQYKVSCYTEDGEEGEASAPVKVEY